METKTLTLKKKIIVPQSVPKEKAGKKIVDLELPQLIGKFVVMRQSSNHRAMKFTFAHEHYDTALAEANRLNAESLSQGKESRYLVMVAISQVGSR